GVGEVGRGGGGDCPSRGERDRVQPRQRPGMGPPIYSTPSRRRRSRTLRAASPNSLSAEPLSVQLLSERVSALGGKADIRSDSSCTLSGSADKLLGDAAPHPPHTPT